MTSMSSDFTCAPAGSDDNSKVKLNNPCRLSLTDITKATIGNLSEWADNSERLSDNDGIVLRPWEDNSVETDQLCTDSIKEERVFTQPPPPTYHEHVKRHLDEQDHNDTKKRRRTETSAFHQLPTAIQKFYEKNSGLCNSKIFNKDSSHTFQSHYSKNMKHITDQSMLRNSTQSFMKPSTPGHLPPQTTNKLQGPQLNEMPNLEPSESSYQTSIYHSYLPWMNSSIEVKHCDNQEQVSSASHQNIASPNVLTEQSYGNIIQPGFVAKQIPLNQLSQFEPYSNIIQPQNSLVHMSQMFPALQKVTLQPSVPLNNQGQNNTGDINFSATNCYRPPLSMPTQPTVNVCLDNQRMPKVINSVDNIPQTPETLFNLINLQAAIGCDDNKENINITPKQEPKTPITKLQKQSNYDSPAMDSRFTESLYNLLGSPPPDSPVSKNPILKDLQALLNRECKKEVVPQSLFGMQGSKNETKTIHNVFERERNLQDRFSKLQSSNPEEVRQLSSMFRYQSALIETDRFRTLHESQYPGSYKESVNDHFDHQLHKVMDRVEKSIQLLENSASNAQSRKSIKLRPHLSKESVQLMESWYRENLSHPYPTTHVIEMLAQTGNISVEQVKKWFANKRNRNSNTRSLTEIAMQKRKLGHLSGQ